MSYVHASSDLRANAGDLSFSCDLLGLDTQGTNNGVPRIDWFIRDPQRHARGAPRRPWGPLQHHASLRPGGPGAAGARASPGQLTPRAAAGPGTLGVGLVREAHMGDPLTRTDIGAVAVEREQLDAARGHARPSPPANADPPAARDADM